ncbi:MAG TPA: hypothetical protein VGA67_04230 [Candidatus Dojkabacteria bacterium]|jgi:hypothetical protein
MGKTAYILPPKLSSIVEKIQKELGLNEPGEVITKAIELLDYSIGRKVILEDKDKKRSIQIDSLKGFHETFDIDSNGSSHQ